MENEEKKNIPAESEAAAPAPVCNCGAEEVKPEAPVCNCGAEEVKPEAPVCDCKAEEVKPETPVCDCKAEEVEPEAPVCNCGAEEVKPEAPACDCKAEEVEPETPACDCKAEEVKPVEERKPRQYLEVTQEMLEETSRRLGVMLDYLGLEGTVKAEKRTTKINLIVSSSDAGRIIGRKGQSLESLQLLLNRMMQKVNIDYPKIYIDIDGYPAKGADESSEKRRTPRGFERDDRGEHSEHAERQERPDRGERSERPERAGRDDRRGGRRFDRGDRGFDRGERNDRGDRGFDRDERNDRGDRGFDRDDRRPRRGGFEEDEGAKDENLRQQALDTAKEVRRWGESVTLPPMNSHDRRIIHITLENEADLSTDSVGDGSLKSVVIALKKQE